MTTRVGLLWGDGDPRHGTVNGYANLRCRCQLCRIAGAALGRQRRVARSALLLPSDPRHGRYTTYLNHNCRCEPCTGAQAERMRVYRSVRVGAS